MQMMDEILSDGRMDKLEKIEKLEAILSAVTSSTTDQLSANNVDASSIKCVCMCQDDKIDSPRTNRQAAGTSVACQTLSTGDIVFTRVFVSEEEKERVRLLNSPKK